MNRSGDQLALDDFMDKQSLDDLIDFVCSEYTAPPQREWQRLTDKEREEATGWSVEHIEAKLKEKNT